MFNQLIFEVTFHKHGKLYLILKTKTQITKVFEFANFFLTKICKNYLKLGFYRVSW